MRTACLNAVKYTPSSPTLNTGTWILEPHPETLAATTLNPQANDEASILNP